MNHHRNQLGRKHLFPVQLEQKLKDALFAQDSNLEIFRNRKKNRYEAWRVKFYAGVSSDDLLLFEFNLQHPPGMWLINHLRKHDSWARNGKESTLDFILGEIDEHDKLFERNRQLRISELSMNCAKELLTYAVRQKKHFTSRKKYPKKNVILSYG